MKMRHNIKVVLIFFCAMFVLLCTNLLAILVEDGARLIANSHNTHIRKRESMVTIGELLDRKGTVLAYSDQSGERRYAELPEMRQALCHIVGDTHGQTIGAESTFSRYIHGFDHTHGEIIKQHWQGEFMSGSDVSLTVDADLSLYIAQLMGENQGGVVLMNYRTGEILACVSMPSFDPEMIQQYLSGEEELEDGALINRATMGYYTPGSVFKLVTLTAALRYLDGAEDMRFHCDGPLAFDQRSGRMLPELKPKDDRATESNKRSVDGPADYAGYGNALSSKRGRYNVFRDSHGEYHGTVSLEEAFAQSCNISFAQLAMMLGAQRLEETAKELCIGEDFRFDDIIIYKSAYDAGNTDWELSGSAIGQYKDLMTPIQMCMLSGAVANDGVMMEPKLLLEVRTPSSEQSERLQSKAHKRLFGKEEAKTLQGYMRGVVQKGTGKGASVAGFDVCGKTGSAEISSDKSVNTHAWFTGFVLDDEHPLAICVLLERAGTGGTTAAPLASKALKKAIELGY